MLFLLKAAFLNAPHQCQHGDGQMGARGMVRRHPPILSCLDTDWAHASGSFCPRRNEVYQIRCLSLTVCAVIDPRTRIRGGRTYCRFWDEVRVGWVLQGVSRRKTDRPKWQGTGGSESAGRKSTKFPTQVLPSQQTACKHPSWSVLSRALFWPSAISL